MTILGYHSVAELSDLVLAKDVAMRNLGRRFLEVANTEQDFSTFVPVYQALVARYNVARAIAQEAINNSAYSARPTNMIRAEDEYNGLLTALNPRWQEHTWSPGDGSLEDLYAQVIAFGSTGKNDEPTPQPQSGSDYDFNVLTTTGQVTSAIEGVGQLFDAKHLLLYAVIGSVFVVFVLPKLMALSMPGASLLRR